MNLKHLEFLKFVISEGSFAAAARQAGVSQPAITQAMQSLERDLDIALFKKVGRQKVPTPSAVALAESASNLLLRMSHMSKATIPTLEWSIEPGRAALRVGMAPAAALLYGPTVQREWLRTQEIGLFQIVTNTAPQMLSALQAGELDLVIAPGPRRHWAAGIRRKALYTSKPTIYARKGHPLSKVTSLNNIASAGWAVAGRAGTAGNVVEEAYRVRGLPDPLILVQCADYPTLLHLVAQTDLLCVVPHPILLRSSEPAAVHALHIREGLPQYEVCIFWPIRSRELHGAIDEIVRVIVETVPN